MSEPALLRKAGRAEDAGRAAALEVLAAAGQGDERCVIARDDVADWLGVGVAAVVNLLNPSVVVLGGLFADVLAAAEETVMAAFEASSLRAPRQQSELRPAALGADAPLVGAAEIAFASLLADPLTQAVASGGAPAEPGPAPAGSGTSLAVKGLSVGASRDVRARGSRDRP